MTEAIDRMPVAVTAATPGAVQMMLDHMRHGVALYDSEHRLIAANTLAHRLAAAMPDAPPAADALAATPGQPRLHSVTRPDGTVIERLTEPTPDGGYVITFSDVTARTQAEAAAEQRSATLQAALDAMRHGCMIFDAAGALLAANTLAATCTGLRPEDLFPGQSAERLLALQRQNGSFGDGPAADARLQQLLARDRRTVLKDRRTTPDGRNLEVVSVPTPEGGYVVAFTDITALASAEAAANERAGLLQGMLENMRHGITMVGADGIVAAANDLSSDLRGLPRGTVRPGKRFEAIVRERVAADSIGDAAADATAIETILRRDRSRPYRLTRGTSDGRMIDVYSDPMPDGGFVVSYIDITAQAQAEAAAQARAALLQTMQDTMRQGIALFDADRRLITANRLVMELGGVPSDALVPGLTHAAMIQHQLATGVFGCGPAAEMEASRVIGCDRGQRQQSQREMPDGKVVDSTSDPMPDGGFVVTWSDVTALVRAERAAEQRAATLQAMIENMRHGVALFGPDRRLLAANRLVAELGHFPPGTLAPGRSYDALVAVQRASGVTGNATLDTELATRAIAEDRSRPIRYTRPGRDGRIIEATSNPMPDGGFVISLTDITALARAEAETKRRAEVQALMLDTIRHGITFFGPDHRLIATNRLSHAISGRLPQHAQPGMTFSEVVHAQQAGGVLGPEPGASAYVRRALATDRSRHHRHQRRTTDGRLIEVVSDPTPDGGFAVTFSDITALAEAEAVAASRAAMLGAALDNMRHGIQLFGPDRRLLAHNDLSVTYCGLQPEDIFDGITFDEAARRMHRRGVLGPDPGASQAVQARIERDRSQPYRSQRLAPDGTVIEVFSDPTPDGGFVITLTDITALARAEAAAQEQAATLRAAIDSTRHGIALYGPDRRLRIANRLSGRAHGLPELEKRVGARLEDLIAEQLAQGSFGEGEEAARTAAELTRVDRSKSLHFQCRMASGKVLDIASDPTPDGGFVITHSDVTELVEAKADASTRAGILQVMLDNIRHGITYYGPDRRVITSNALADGLAGHPPGSVVPGRSLDELIDAQLETSALADDIAGIAGMARTLDRSRPAGYVRRLADGRTVEVTSDPTPDGGFVITMTDISALAGAEGEAKKRASMLQAMLDNIRHGIALFDADGRVLAANPVFRALLDLPAEVIAPGRPMADFVNLMLERGEYGEGEAGLAAAQAMLGRDRTQPLRTTRTRPNGMTVETVSDPIPGAGWVITYTDVTEDRRIRAELEREKIAAEAANTAKSRFLATMSHELRTPLNAVIGFSEAYLAAPDPARGLDYMRSIHEAGRHLLSLIDDILDVTRAETSGFAVTAGEVDARALAEGAVRVMRATAATAGVVLQAALPPALPWVRADELRMRQVLLNLLSNAVKFTPAGGTVTLAGAQEGGDLVLRVTDTGIGMRPEDIPRAFEPFTQLDSSLARRFPGSGLGLYLSKALAEAQGAALSLESTPGQGTTAVLRIPQALLLAPAAI